MFSIDKNKSTLTITLRVKCLYLEFFWSVSPYIFVFNLNAGKYGPEKLVTLVT